MVMGDLPVETDVLIIGGGPGGYAAAFRAADLGLDVTLVCDEPKLGGVCLLRGCIPSKTLLYLAELIHAAQASADMGIAFGEPKIDLDKLRGWKDKVVDRLTTGLDALCEQRGVRRVRGRARFAGSDQVRLTGSDLSSIRFEHAIIATGSRPQPLPGIEFGGRVMDSSGALALPDIPERLLVVGGGYVGLEMGMVYAALGSRVTLIELSEQLLPNADADLVEPLAERARTVFEAVQLQTKLAELTADDDGVTVSTEGEAEMTGEKYDRVLIAVGRQPNSDDLGLSNTAVEVDEQDCIRVDAERRTAEANIFAIGDVAGGQMLAHEAMHEGKIAAEVIAGKPAAFDVRAIPAVVYTDPQLAWCGLTEQQAKAENREVNIGRFPWRASGRALSFGAERGLTKLITDPQSGQVLGMGVVGREAEALIAEGVLAIEMGAVAQDLALSIHSHPTLSETVGEAAEAVLGRATHL